MQMTRHYRSVREGNKDVAKLAKKGWTLIATDEVPQKPNWRKSLLLGRFWARKLTKPDYVCTYSNE